MKKTFALTTLLLLFTALAYAGPPLPNSPGGSSSFTLPASPTNGNIVKWGANNYTFTDGGSLAPDNSTAAAGGSFGLLKDSSGNIVADTITGSGMTAGRAYYLASNVPTAADATSAATLPRPAVCVALSATVCAKSGVWVTTGLTADSLYYVPVATGGGALTTTPPAASGNIRQIVGYSEGTTKLHIAPQLVTVEVK